MNVGIDRPDAPCRFATVDTGRHPDVDKGDGEGHPIGTGLLDGRDGLQPLKAVATLSRNLDRPIARRFAEQLGRHGVQRSRPRREAQFIAFMNRRFVVDDQNTHPATTRHSHLKLGRMVTKEA